MLNCFHSIFLGVRQSVKSPPSSRTCPWTYNLRHPPFPLLARFSFQKLPQQQLCQIHRISVLMRELFQEPTLLLASFLHPTYRLRGWSQEEKADHKSLRRSCPATCCCHQVNTCAHLPPSHPTPQDGFQWITETQTYVRSVFGVFVKRGILIKSIFIVNISLSSAMFLPIKPFLEVILFYYGLFSF